MDNTEKYIFTIVDGCNHVKRNAFAGTNQQMSRKNVLGLG